MTLEAAFILVFSPVKSSVTFQSGLASGGVSASMHQQGSFEHKLCEPAIHDSLSIIKGRSCTSKQGVSASLHKLAKLDEPKGTGSSVSSERAPILLPKAMTAKLSNVKRKNRAAKSNSESEVGQREVGLEALRQRTFAAISVAADDDLELVDLRHNRSGDEATEVIGAEDLSGGGCVSLVCGDEVMPTPPCWSPFAGCSICESAQISKSPALSK